MREPLRRLTRTSGGSRETDMKAVAVMPTSSPRGPSVSGVVRGHQDHARGQPGHGGAELVVAHPLSMGDGRRDAAVAGSRLQHIRHASPGACRSASGPGTSRVLRTLRSTDVVHGRPVTPRLRSRNAQGAPRCTRDRFITLL